MLGGTFSRRALFPLKWPEIVRSKTTSLRDVATCLHDYTRYPARL